MLQHNFKVLMKRILVQYLPVVSHLTGVNQHIIHQYTADMSRKSVVVKQCALVNEWYNHMFIPQVPLGVHLKDENKLNDMVDILDELHKYVPMVKTTETFDTAGPSGSWEVAEIDVCHFHHILIGGDQLTVARVRGSQRARRNSNNGKSRFEGFVPVIEDWHTKMCAMKVSVCALVTTVCLVQLSLISP